MWKGVSPKLYCVDKNFFHCQIYCLGSICHASNITGLANMPALLLEDSQVVFTSEVCFLFSCSHFQMGRDHWNLWYTMFFPHRNFNDLKSVVFFKSLFFHLIKDLIYVNLKDVVYNYLAHILRHFYPHQYS